MAAQSNILAWEIPWTEEADRLQSMGFAELDMTLQLNNIDGWLCQNSVSSHCLHCCYPVLNPHQLSHRLPSFHPCFLPGCSQYSSQNEPGKISKMMLSLLQTLQPASGSTSQSPCKTVYNGPMHFLLSLFSH